MIVYYSATGNTEWMARRLSTLLLEKDVLSLSCDRESIMDMLPRLGKEDRLVICFPIHGWGILRPVSDFVLSLPRGLALGDIYMACTCGDDIGKSHEMMREMLAERGYSLRAAFSLQMPNTYVNLPFFDVDSSEVREDKLRARERRAEEIAGRILSRSAADDVVTGDMASLKSGLLRSMFLHLVSDRWFHSTSSCIGCGICQRSCPENNIAMENGRPVWLQSGRCTTCMSCYHHCPRHAVRFGRITDRKGQYYLPQEERKR